MMVHYQIKLGSLILLKISRVNAKSTTTQLTFLIFVLKIPALLTMVGQITTHLPFLFFVLKIPTLLTMVGQSFCRCDEQNLNDMQSFYVETSCHMSRTRSFYMRHVIRVILLHILYLTYNLSRNLNKRMRNGIIQKWLNKDVSDVVVGKSKQ